MGYQSEVAYAVLFKNSQDRDTILNELTTAQREVIQEQSDIQEDRVLFHDNCIKWYSSRLVMSDDGYPGVDAHEAFIDTARQAYFEGRISSMGVFFRLGEDDDDSEKDTWNSGEDGFPEWYDLVDYRRELTIGW